MDEPWFRPKRYGYGAGTPVHWKGWALLLAMFLSMALAAVATVTLLPRVAPDVPRRLVLSVAVLLSALPFALIARARTEGGWRWRSGKD